MTTALQDPKTFYKRTMGKAPEAVRNFYTALTGKNKDLLLSALSDDFTFKSAMASVDKPEDYVAMVGSFGGWVETENLVVDGNKVAHTFTYHMTEPSELNIPICDFFTLVNGKIKSIRAYNDSADFPKPDVS